jgi:hypothetical protein
LRPTIFEFDHAIARVSQNMTPADIIEKFIAEIVAAPRVSAAMERGQVTRDQTDKIATALRAMERCAQADPLVRPFLARALAIIESNEALKPRGIALLGVMMITLRFIDSLEDGKPRKDELRQLMAAAIQPQSSMAN